MTCPLLVDCYQGDGPKDWKKLAAAGAPWIGAVLKATQGTYYASEWFTTQSRAVREAGGDRFGIDWFRGAYHYLDLSQDGAEQARWFLHAIEHIGGFAIGDLWPMVDVERAGQRNLTKQNVVDCTSKFAEVITRETGRTPTLYGGELLAALGITDRMGCGRLAIARYTPTLPPFVWERIGWDEKSLLLWQYCGDGDAALPNYPREAPGCGKNDISAVVLPGGLEAMRASLWAERPAP